MLKKMIFYSLLYFLNEFQLSGMSWLSKTPEKPQPSNVVFTVESHGYLYIFRLYRFKIIDIIHLTVLLYCCSYIQKSIL